MELYLCFDISCNCVYDFKQGFDQIFVWCKFTVGYNTGLPSLGNFPMVYKYRKIFTTDWFVRSEQKTKITSHLYLEKKLPI